MKRSIISLIVLVIFITTAVSCELLYTIGLAEDLQIMLDKCEKEKSIDKRIDICYALKHKFLYNQTLNKLFFTKKLIEKVSVGISELTAYAEQNDESEFRAALQRLKNYTEHIYYAGTF